MECHSRHNITLITLSHCPRRGRRPYFPDPPLSH